MSIILFSRPIRSGKTTELQDWCYQRTDAGGILMPDKDGRRKMFDIRSKTLFDAECDRAVTGDEPVVNIGPFSFYTSAFEKANTLLRSELQHQPQWLIIDEVGKLEMMDKGFAGALKILIPLYQNPVESSGLLLVVRDSLLEAVCSHFEIQNPVIINTLQQLV